MTVSKLYSPEEREHILRLIVNALEVDERIAGIVLVGSGAVGFEDEYSDIDLSVVVEKRDDVKPIFRQWDAKMKATVPVICCFETEYAPDNLLWGFFLDNILEVDMGFLHPGKLL
jgi:predicted nucleotidyltransferase